MPPVWPSAAAPARTPGFDSRQDFKEILQGHVARQSRIPRQVFKEILQGHITRQGKARLQGHIARKDCKAKDSKAGFQSRISRQDFETPALGGRR
jgi:hypothetical protein